MDKNALAFALLLTSLNLANGVNFSSDTIIWTSRSDGITTTFDMPGVLYINLSNTSLEFTNNPNPPVITDFAYSYWSGISLYIDASNLRLMISDNNITRPFHQRTSFDVGHVAIDWVSGNVYWTDQGFRWIAMSNIPKNISTKDPLDQGFKVVAEKHVDKPTGIAVYPNKFYLFWADEGKTPKIERSSLNGTDRTVIVWKSVLRPRSITIDIKKDLLYWTDPARYTIESCKLDGGQRVVLVYRQGEDYYGVAVFKEYLLYTIPSLNMTFTYNLDKYYNIYLKMTETVYGVSVLSRSLQPRGQNEPCDTNRTDIMCEQICIQTSHPKNNGFDCFCEDGYRITDDGKSCQNVNSMMQLSLVFTNGNRICQYPLNEISYTIFATSCNVIVHEKNITRFVLDMINDVIIFTDGLNIYQQQSFNNSTRKLLTTTNTGIITGMTFDWTNRTVYWTKKADGKVYFTKVGTVPSMIQMLNLEETDITYLAMDPQSRTLFYVHENSGGSRLRAKNVDNNDPPITMSTHYLHRPSDLELDFSNRRLVWIEGSWIIVSIKVDGTDEQTLNTALLNVADTLAYEQAVLGYKRYAGRTSSDTEEYTLIIQYSTNLPIPINITNMSSPILDMHIFDTNLQPIYFQEQCGMDNGGCQQMCLPEGELSHRCACFYGYHLQPDKRTCTTQYTGSDDYFIVLDAEHGIIRIDQSENETYVLESNVNMASSMTFDQKRNELLWADAAKKTMKRKHVEQDLGMPFGESFLGQAKMAVDSTTGNIYYSDGRILRVVSREGSIKTLLGQDKIGPIKKMTLFPAAGIMAWTEDSPTRVIQANMDGTNIRNVEFIPKNDMVPDDIVYDTTVKDPVLYYCYSKNDTIYRQQNILYERKGYRPIALDVTEHFVFFVPDRNTRSIVRINKSDGSGAQTVFESPLAGMFVALYVTKPAAIDHATCSQCNGGCSTLCLPNNAKSRTCECADNDRISGGEICEKVSVCDIINNVDGLIVGTCCPNLPNAVCHTNCSAGYMKHRDVLKCENGQWNYSPESICEEMKMKEGGITERNLYIYIGAAAGAVVALVIVIVIVFCCCCRKARASKDAFNGPQPVCDYIQPISDTSYDAVCDYIRPTSDTSYDVHLRNMYTSINHSPEETNESPVYNDPNEDVMNPCYSPSPCGKAKRGPQTMGKTENLTPAKRLHDQGHAVNDSISFVSKESFADLTLPKVTAENLTSSFVFIHGSLP